jgi:serpin B
MQLLLFSDVFMKIGSFVAVVVALIIVIAASMIYFVYEPLGSDVVDSDIPSDDDDLIPLGNMSFQDAVNTFGFDLFNKLYSSEGGNVFISPYSVFTALAMTYEGARGQTADEMGDVLNVLQDNVSFHAYVQNMYKQFNSEELAYNLSTANALWVQETFELLEEYLSVISEFYGGGANDVDFGNAVIAAGIINRWVENETNGLIKNLVPVDAISPLTALILTNAIYFKGVWEIQFDPVNTSDRSFVTADDGNVLVPTMQMVDTHQRFRYSETESVQVLELPYAGDDVSMVIVLPKDQDVIDVIADMDADVLSEWTNSFVETEVDIYLPSFEVESSYSLVGFLASLGMNIPFGSNADFSGINGAPDLFISDVLHKAFINVNEEGTEAAAATAVIMELTATPGGEEPERILFNCDHPFLYMIQHQETETILFMGVVDNPNTS